jgi:hypothetical protein
VFIAGQAMQVKLMSGKDKMWKAGNTIVDSGSVVGWNFMIY